MPLKLFRHTGSSSILVPGETRVAPHPGWLVLGVSAWIGVACNVNLWRAAMPGPMGGSWGQVVATGLFFGGLCGALLSLLGWRRTLKLAATLLLFAAALMACGLWARGLALDIALFERGLAQLLPPLASLKQWQVPALFAVLGLPQSLWVWNFQQRRLSGPEQLGANATGVVLGGISAAAGFFLPALLRLV